MDEQRPELTYWQRVVAGTLIFALSVPVFILAAMFGGAFAAGAVVFISMVLIALVGHWYNRNP